MAGGARAVVTRIEFHSDAFVEVMQCEAVQRDLGQRAERVAAAAGDGFEARVSVGETRARAVVITGTAEAREAEATDKVLTKAIEAGR